MLNKDKLVIIQARIELTRFLRKVVKILTVALVKAVDRNSTKDLIIASPEQEIISRKKPKAEVLEEYAWCREKIHEEIALEPAIIF